VVVKRFAVDRPDTLADTAVPPHHYDPYCLRLDLKTHSTRLLHSSIQQTSVDATPEHHAAVVSGLAAAGMLSAPPSRDDRRSSSVASAGKKTVAFANTVVVCDDSGGEPKTVVTRWLPANNVLQVHSQTGEVVGDVLIERKRDPPPPPPVDDHDDHDDHDNHNMTTTVNGCSRRKRHELFCRRRQSPVYSCDDGDGSSSSSSSSVSVYMSCEELPVVVLGRRPPPVVNGYGGCCPL